MRVEFGADGVDGTIERLEISGDVAAFLLACGTCVSDPSYDPATDFDDSGCVDLPDLATLLCNYGGGPPRYVVGECRVDTMVE